MTELQARLADANPVRDEDVDEPEFESLWHRFENGPRRERSSAQRLRPANRPQRHRLAGWAVAGLVAVAATVSLLVVGVTGGGPTRAFAGWSADPTTPQSGQLAAAQTLCRAQNPGVGSAPATVADVRGPYALLVWVENENVVSCIAGAQETLMSGGTQLTATPPVAANEIAPESMSYSNASAPWDGQGASTLTGVVGADVTAVTLVLDDGSNIETTVANGWFASWWPAKQGVRSAEITTQNGTNTQRLNLVLPTAPQPSAGASGASGNTANG